MRFWRSLLRAFARRHPPPPRRARSHDEVVAVRQRQREIAARAEALGVRVDVVTREGARR
jgi:hypothetical protein